jgi:hypothetical protein
VSRAAVALLVVALAALARGDVPPPSGSDGPDFGTGRVRFDHARHAGHVGECSACHRYAAEGTAPGAEVPAPQFERPGEADCTPCHPFVRPAVAERVGRADPEACALCHPLDGAGRVALPAVAPRFPAVDFDHRAHDEASAAPCSACHDAAQLAARTTPSMRRCLACHDDALDGGCAECHLHDVRGRVLLDRPGHPRLIPTEWMGDLWHSSGFAQDHAVPARTRRDACDACHESTFCEGCHLGEALERRFHPAGWITAHGAARRSTELDCETCHRGQEMCLSCHRRAGVTLDSPELGRGVARGLEFHAEGWSLRPEEHARDARRNLSSCVSCHSGADCLACHATGVSPHGAGWSARCSGLRGTSPETCLTCHATVPECR